MASAGAFYEVGTLTGGHLADGSVVGQDGHVLTAAERAEQYFGSADYFKNVAGHALIGCAASALGGGSFAGEDPLYKSCLPNPPAPLPAPFVHSAPRSNRLIRP